MTSVNAILRYVKTQRFQRNIIQFCLMHNACKTRNAHTEAQMRAKRKILRLFFLRRGQKHVKNRGRSLDGSSLIARRREGEPLALLMHFGIAFRFIDKMHLAWRTRGTFSHSNNIRRDEATRARSHVEGPEAWKLTPHQRTWRAFVIMRASRG